MDNRFFKQPILNSPYECPSRQWELDDTVMAWIIARQTINAARRAQSRRFTRGFLVVTPGIAIKDRLRALQPDDPDSYYASRELVPGDLLEEVNRAKIVITNMIDAVAGAAV